MKRKKKTLKRNVFKSVLKITLKRNVVRRFRFAGGGTLKRTKTTSLTRWPRSPHAVIPESFLEPLGRSWSHFVGNYRQKLTKAPKNDF